METRLQLNKFEIKFWSVLFRQKYLNFMKRRLLYLYCNLLWTHLTIDTTSYQEPIAEYQRLEGELMWELLRRPWKANASTERQHITRSVEYFVHEWGKILQFQGNIYQLGLIALVWITNADVSSHFCFLLTCSFTSTASNISLLPW